MKNLFIILTLLTISCKSQIISLENEAQCLTNPNCPDYTYAKDINNSLDKYIGTWEGIYEGKTYELQLKKGFYQDLTLSVLKRDRLIGRLRIKDSDGNILHNTISEVDDTKTKFSGLGFQSDLKVYNMYFSGGKLGCIDYGDVYLIIKPATPNQMTMDFLPDNDIVMEGECTDTFVPTLPYRKTIDLIKQ